MADRFGRTTLSGANANYAMALDVDAHRLVVAFRTPACLANFDTSTGKRLAILETCRDADDVFVDARRHRVYVSCGEGLIDVIAQGGRWRLPADRSHSDGFRRTNGAIRAGERPPLPGSAGCCDGAGGHLGVQVYTESRPGKAFEGGDVRELPLGAVAHHALVVRTATERAAVFVGKRPAFRLVPGVCDHDGHALALGLLPVGQPVGVIGASPDREHQ